MTPHSGMPKYRAPSGIFALTRKAFARVTVMAATLQWTERAPDKEESVADLTAEDGVVEVMLGVVVVVGTTEDTTWLEEVVECVVLISESVMVVVLGAVVVIRLVERIIGMEVVLKVLVRAAEWLVGTLMTSVGELLLV